MTAEVISIPRAALHEQVAARLRQMLVEGRIAPGAKLNERELSELLEVSRTPLREAIKMLAAEGLVELLPNRGAIALELSETDGQRDHASHRFERLLEEELVDLLPNRGAIALELSETDVLNTFEVMAGLEAQCGELAAQRITEAELAEIRAMHFEMMAAYTRRDLSAYYSLNARIHRAICAAAKNPVLAAVYHQVNARLQALRFRSNQDGAKWTRAMKEHEKMIDALAARDAAAMRDVLLTHLRNKRDVVLEQLHGQDAQRADGRGG